MALLVCFLGLSRGQAPVRLATDVRLLSYGVVISTPNSIRGRNRGYWRRRWKPRRKNTGSGSQRIWNRARVKVGGMTLFIPSSLAWGLRLLPQQVIRLGRV
ncbi:hypothetical protein BDV93DRAFT_106878 [Ceratobasidium sp. AG-I]|nr:hypothetical protein BDV93DRAFT_106878 [Ceratobasidium sp. AG-I]